MQIAIFVLLVILIAVVVYFGMQARANKSEIALPAPLDTDAIARTVQTAINLEAISTSVQGAVAAQMLKTAQEALAANNQQTTQQANQTLTSQKEALGQQTKILLQPFETQIAQLTASVTALQGSYTSEKSTVDALLTQVNNLQTSTTTLQTALKSPTARGSWGENQLRNVIALAGMENYCDFTEQFTGGEGERNQRPDVVINLAGGAHLAVDSKAPLAAYMRMSETDDVAQKEIELKQHARDLRQHVKTLSEKKYWDQFGHASPDFVVMFIPGEGFVSDAMRADSSLMEDAMKANVIIASPVNLLSLLLTVSKSWQSHQLAEHAEKVAKLGVEVYERIGTVIDEMNKMGKNLGTTNTAFNTMAGSFESRLLVTLRKFKDLGVTQGELSEVKQIDSTPRAINASEATNQIASGITGELGA
ncbi:MAG: DNA recombination protein RmuC, partial [Ilumatobacteraceae bacterium]|nr:DNA recombination protein RmuC [Ilumatobacteraceae bacterium]